MSTNRAGHQHVCDDLDMMLSDPIMPHRDSSQEELEKARYAVSMVPSSCFILLSDIIKCTMHDHEIVAKFDTVLLLWGTNVRLHNHKNMGAVPN